MLYSPSVDCVGLTPATSSLVGKRTATLYRIPLEITDFEMNALSVTQSINAELSAVPFRSLFTTQVARTQNRIPFCPSPLPLVILFVPILALPPLSHRQLTTGTTHAAARGENQSFAIELRAVSIK